MLFVDHQEAEVSVFNVFTEQYVGANDNIHFAFGQALLHARNLLSRANAREDLDIDGPVGETVAERTRMLLGEQGGARQYGFLLAAVAGNKRRAHGDLGFTKAHIPAHQTSHRW